MPTPNKIYARGEKPHYVFDQNRGIHAFNKYFYIRMGVVQDVDPDRLTMSVKWLRGDGARNQIPVSFPYAGPASLIGMIPEIGSIGIFGFFDEGGGKGSPLCLAFLPAGLSSGLNQNTVKTLPDAIPTDDVNEIAYRFRKLREGDMIVTAPAGSGLFLNNSIELYDSERDMIMIREDDQAIIQTSINNFVFADGASIALGPAVRNGLVLYDNKGNRDPEAAAAPVTGSGGRETIYMTPGGKNVDFNSRYYAEFRVDVDDYGDGKLDLNDVNGVGMTSTRDPIVTMALGNYIGSNRSNDGQYGRILRPILFRDPDDKDGDFSLAMAMRNAGLDEPEILGLAYALHFQKSGSFFGVDKEGHYYINLARSNTNPMGAGRSMSILAAGNLKEIWGADAKEANSWDLTTKGGVKWDIGKSNTGVGFAITADGGANFEFGADQNGTAKSEVISGNVTQTIGGNLVASVGNSDLTINGLKRENVTGSTSEIVQGDKTVNVMGVSTETVIKEKQCKFGKRKTTITSGNDESTLIKGNITETIMGFGKRSTTVTTGSIEQLLVAGKYKVNVTTGSYKLAVTTGAMEMKTAAGAATFGGTTAKVSAQTLATTDSPMVKLGKGAAIGGVVSGMPGKPNHFDYVTGAPLKGSSKVSVG